MKKNVLALSIAAMVAGFAGSAYAIDPVINTGTTADALRFGNTGTGHMLLVPYFSSQGGNMTLLALTNTDQRNGKAVKVRFRGAQNSDDLRDFQVFLSPGDVWTGAVVQGADGRSTLISADNSCTKPTRAEITVPFGTSRLDPALDAAAKAAGTREGYVEIFNMADIEPNVSSTVPAGAVAGTVPDGYGLYPLIKHPANGAPGCKNVAANVALGVPANTAWSFIDGSADGTINDRSYAELTTVAAAANTVGLKNPTTGLMANWTIINVPNATSWTGSAAAIEAVDTAGATPVLGAGSLVYFPQTDRTAQASNVAAATADPLLIATAVDKTPNPVPAAITALKVDLPDMSTPYAGAANPSAQAATLATSIATTSLMNEFWSNPDIDGATDWVMSMPTRRYAVAVNYKMTQAFAGAEAYTAGGPITAPGRVFNPANVAHFTKANTKLTKGVACVTGITPTLFDREENSLGKSSGGVVVSPAEPGAELQFCGETAVLAFNNAGSATSAVLNGGLTVSGIDSNFLEGWARLATPGLTGAPVGLPILGSAFASAYNPQVNGGVSGNYSLTWEHRYARP